MEISKVTQGGVPLFPSDRQQQVSEEVKTDYVKSRSIGLANDTNQKSITKEEVEKTVKALNDMLSSMNSHLKFMYHEKLKEYYVTIVDNNTNQVVKEIPPKKILDVVASIWEQIGIIVDRKG